MGLQLTFVSKLTLKIYWDVHRITTISRVCREEKALLISVVRGFNCLIKNSTPYFYILAIVLS